jgi:hypothetical protein
MASSDAGSVPSMAAIEELVRVRMQHETLWSALRASHGAAFDVWATTAEAAQREATGDPSVSVSAQVSHYSHLLARAREVYFPAASGNVTASQPVVPSESEPAGPTLDLLGRGLLPLFTYMQDKAGKSTLPGTPFPNWSLDALTALAFSPDAGVPSAIAEPLQNYLRSLPGFDKDEMFQPDSAAEVHDTLHRQFLVAWSRRAGMANGAPVPRMSP